MALIDSTHLDDDTSTSENNHNGCVSSMTDHPVEVVGKFLDKFLSIKKYQSSLVFTEPDLHHEGYDFNLYSALNYSNMEVVRLIFWIFKKRFPYSFQLLQCSSSTCEEELTLFFQRMDHYPNFLYLILGINRLTMEMQQVCMHNATLRKKCHFLLL